MALQPWDIWNPSIFSNLEFIYRLLNGCRFQSFFQNLNLNLWKHSLVKIKNCFRTKQTLNTSLHQSKLPYWMTLKTLQTSVLSISCCVLGSAFCRLIKTKRSSSSKSYYQSSIILPLKFFTSRSWKKFHHL